MKMVKMANKKTRGPDKSSNITPNIVIEKLDDAADIVQQAPVFTNDSKYLCIASGRYVGIYSVDSGQRIHSLKRHAHHVVGLGIKDDNTLYSCDSSGKIIEWNVQSAEMLNEFSIAIPGLKEFFSFLHVGNSKFLLTTPGPNSTSTSSSLWVVDNGLRHKKLFADVNNKPHSIAFGCQLNGSLIVAALKESCVVVKDLRSGVEKKHMTDERKFTCVALHKEQPIMATGDISGRVIIWHDFIDKSRPVKTVYHWHTLPVSAVCFSSEGEYLYSGGSEKVMVKWRLGMSRKQFLPRMGSTITYIVNAPDNICIATSHSDNAIRFINSTNKINQAVLGLVKHDPIRGLDKAFPIKESVMPTGLVLDPRSQGIFFNAQSGFLQLYDPNLNTMVFNLDIANRNVLTDERNRVIGNSEVVRAAASSNGVWLATLEVWSNTSVGYLDMKLKFWRYSTTESNYVLNTDVTMPHNDRVTALAFQPGLLGIEWPCLVSLGCDLKFKIWRLVDDTDIYKKKEAWTCDVAGDFRKLLPTALSFSEDGSLLAIAFQDIVTLWDPITSNLNTTLSHSLVKQNIEFMEFGRDKCFRYLICASERSLFAWDVISQGLVWIVPGLHSPIRCLVPDSKSIHMAAILANKEIFVFTPSSSKPVYINKKMNSSEPIAAVFVPRPNPLASGPEWLVNSRLLIVDDKQEFFCLDDKSSSQSNQKLTTPISHMDSLPWTPFAAMKAQKQISAVKELVPVVHQTNGIQGYESIQSLLDTSASALPPMSRICSSFLSCLLIKHDPKLLTSKADSDYRSINLPTTNGQSETKMTELNEETTLQNLSSLKYQWLLEDFELICGNYCLRYFTIDVTSRVFEVDCHRPKQRFFCVGEMESACERAVEFELVTCYKCPKCEFVSPDKSKASDHFQQHHTFESVNDLEPLEPSDFLLDDHDPDLSFSSGNEEVFKNEICNSSANAPLGFKCSVESCTVHLESESNAMYHTKCHYEDSYKCPECNETKTAWKSMAMHLWKNHSINLELLSCHLCSYRTGKKELLKFHVKTHSDQRNCLCDECGKGFKNMKQLRNHKDLHSVGKGSSEQQSKNRCSDCGQILSSVRLLRAHRNAVHLKMRSHLCNYCGYNTTSQSNLRIHLRQHTKEKPFACEDCEYRTADHNSLRRHRMKHTGEKRYRCPHCAYASIQSSTYKAHLRNKHPNLSDELIFSCQLCTFRTIRKEQLNMHINSSHKVQIESTANTIV